MLTNERLPDNGQRVAIGAVIPPVLGKAQTQLRALRHRPHTRARAGLNDGAYGDPIPVWIAGQRECARRRADLGCGIDDTVLRRRLAIQKALFPFFDSRPQPGGFVHVALARGIAATALVEVAQQVDGHVEVSSSLILLKQIALPANEAKGARSERGAILDFRFSMIAG